MLPTAHTKGRRGEKRGEYCLTCALCAPKAVSPERARAGSMQSHATKIKIKINQTSFIQHYSGKHKTTMREFFYHGCTSQCLKNFIHLKN